MVFFFFKQTLIPIITGRQFQEAAKNILNDKTIVLIISKVLLISEHKNFSKQLTDAK